MKNKLTNNWGLKLGSLVAAFFLWIIVTNMNNPVIQYRIYNVPVRFANTDIVTAQGKTFEVLDNSDVIDTVTIAAPRSVIDSLSEEDVVAIADFKDLTMQNTISIQLSTNKYNSELQSIKGNIDTVSLDIENLRTKTLALTAVTSGTANDGYVVGEITPAQNQVRISGPESVVTKVATAQAEVSVTGFTQDIVTDCDIKLLDEDGLEVPLDTLKMNISTVKVNVELLQTKRLSLKFASMGTPAEGYLATGRITSEPDSILVAGKAATLKMFEQIEIDEEALNITGQTGDMMALVDIEEYLPYGVKCVDPNLEGKVSVTVYIEKTVDKRLTVSTENIKWLNVPEGYTVELVDPEDEFDITINGLRSTINNVEATDVYMTADLTDILSRTDTVGSLYNVELGFASEKGDIETRSPVKVWFRLKEE